MLELDPDARMLGVLLGLGDLNRPPRHPGYSTGCRCLECRARSASTSPAFLRWLEGESDSDTIPRLRRAPAAPLQPWDVERDAA